MEMDILQIHWGVDQLADMQSQGDGFYRLKLRRGSDTPTTVLEDSEADVLIHALVDFYERLQQHFEFRYATFEQLYSKAAFCADIKTEYFNGDEELFLTLLADRRFLFLEKNESSNDPDSPLLSELAKQTKEYLDAKGNRSAKFTEAMTKLIQEKLIPTDSHKHAYREFTHNLKQLHDALDLRRKHLEQIPTLILDLTIPIGDTPKKPVRHEAELSTLFSCYLRAGYERGYMSQYEELSELPQQNYLPAIRCVSNYLQEKSIPKVYWPLVFFHLFSQYTKKISEGKLKEYKFGILNRSAIRPPAQTPPNARAQNELHIILFDHLLQLFLPETSAPNNEPEIGYAKFLFHYFTKYGGYTHYSVPIFGSFRCRPLPWDGVDNLGNVVRHHIFYCIPNLVSWLTPGLPNDRTQNSEVLAGLLLHDANYLPPRFRLTDKVRRCLDDPEKGPAIISKYQSICTDDNETQIALKKWCETYDLEFAGEDTVADLSPSRQGLRELCSRFVLEYAIKERILIDIRKKLSSIAQTFWGNLCLEGESFDIIQV